MLLNSPSISPNHSSVHTEMHGLFRIGLTDVFTHMDPRRFDPRFRAAK
jgi:hypothetical protein